MWLRAQAVGFGSRFQLVDHGTARWATPCSGPAAVDSRPLGRQTRGLGRGHAGPVMPRRDLRPGTGAEQTPSPVAPLARARELLHGRCATDRVRLRAAAERAASASG